jgi:uncharacterized protein DUF6982/PilZ domain-containing protein
VSPAAAAILDYIEPVDESPRGLELATPADLEREQAHHDRRAHVRHRAEDLRWITRARLNGGTAVSIVDLSASGVLLDAPIPLRPDSLLTLQIDGRHFDKSIPFRVLRCQIGALLPEHRVYRGACEFTSLIELPGECTGGARLLTHPGAFASLDLALKQLVERTGSPGTLGVLDAKSVKQSLESLRDKALKSPNDPIAQPLAGLLDRILPLLDRYRGLAELLPWIESQLRRTVPPVGLRVVDAGTPVRAGMKSVLIQVPGSRATSSWVSVDLPRGFVLSDWQSRVLRVASRLIALLQRIDPGPATGVSIATEAGKEQPAVNANGPAEIEATTQNLGWQKIVVRYTEGQILKGYTQDFNPARSQFSLWPSVTSTARERVIVPLARLKGIFFVRDFAGNPGYVERVDGDQPHHGRRIAVTLVDDEIITGRTLNYRADGQGFFVIPADPLNNNIRIFIVATAVREVRFP